MSVASLTDSGTVDWLRRRPVFDRCIDWLQQHIGNFPDGVTELNGDRLFVNVHGYETKHRNNCAWESHRQTADLQFGISGSEQIDWTAEPVTIDSAAKSRNYDAERDFEIWNDEPAIWQTLTLTPGTMVVFLPGERHRPMVQNS